MKRVKGEKRGQNNGRRGLAGPEASSQKHEHEGGQHMQKQIGQVKNSRVETEKPPLQRPTECGQGVVEPGVEGAEYL